MRYLGRRYEASSRRASALFPLAFFLLPVAFVARPWQALAQGSVSPKDVVGPEAFLSLDPVPRGRAFELAVLVNIRPGYHINAHEVLDSYLIPTELEALLPEGFRVLKTTYPPGRLLKFSFSEEKLSVYTGSATIRMRIEEGAKAPLGEQKLNLVLRYQACNDSMCLPPVKLPVVADVLVAPANAKPRPAHPEIFGGKGS